MVQCQYSIQDGQEVTGQSTFYKDAQAVRKPRQSNDGDESPEGVVDSASVNDEDEGETGAQETTTKKKKRRQRRRKHKNKKKEDKPANQDSEAIAQTDAQHVAYQDFMVATRGSMQSIDDEFADEDDEEVGLEEDDDTLTGEQMGEGSTNEEEEYYSENPDEMMEEELEEEYGD